MENETCLSEEQKEKLRKPLGKLVKNEEIIKEGENIIVVGDFNVLMFLRHGLIPKVAIVDFKTQREAISEEEKRLIENSYSYKVFIKNRRGCISKESQYVPTIIKLMKKAKLLVVVEGEEDLVALPLIVDKDIDIPVIYGIRSIGAVVVDKRLAIPYLEKNLKGLL